MELVKGSSRINAERGADPLKGCVTWRPVKSIWIGSMTLIALAYAPLTAGWGEASLFLVTTGLTLCAGHSVGMHRLLIHRSFTTPKWFEYILVYLGVLVGMAGPFSIIRQHDLRDWAQRQRDCHEYLRHGRGFLLDYFWQCHCDVELSLPPSLKIEPRIANDRFYKLLERTWMLQQAPAALVLYLCGGWSFVVWGVALRVAASVTGHWLIGYFAHHEFDERNANMSWRVLGAAVQGRDVPLAGFISMGESWHNNHHAFPGSARLGLFPGQPDPGWLLIKTLERIGLSSNIITPERMPERRELIRLKGEGTGWKICHWRRLIWREFFGGA